MAEATFENYTALLLEAKGIRDKIQADLVEGIKTSLSKLGQLGDLHPHHRDAIMTAVLEIIPPELTARRTASTAIKGPQGKQLEGTPCELCGFITEPAHNVRQHRFQGEDKRRFTDEELASGTIKKDGEGKVFKRVSEPVPCSFCGATDHGTRGHGLAMAQSAIEVAEQVMGEEPQSDDVGRKAIAVSKHVLSGASKKKAKAKK